MRFKSWKNHFELDKMDDFGAWTRWSADVEIPGTAQKFDLGCTNNPGKKMTPMSDWVYGLVYLSWIIKSPQFAVVDKWTSDSHPTAIRQPSDRSIPVSRSDWSDWSRGARLGWWMIRSIHGRYPSSLPRFDHWPRSNERWDGHDGPLEWVAFFSGNLMGWTWTSLTMVSELSHKHQSIIKWSMSLLLQSRQSGDMFISVECISCCSQLYKLYSWMHHHMFINACQYWASIV